MRARKDIHRSSKSSGSLKVKEESLKKDIKTFHELLRMRDEVIIEGTPCQYLHRNATKNP